MTQLSLSSRVVDPQIQLSSPPRRFFFCSFPVLSPPILPCPPPSSPTSHSPPGNICSKIHLTPHPFAPCFFSSYPRFPSPFSLSAVTRDRFNSLCTPSHSSRAHRRTTCSAAYRVHPQLSIRIVFKNFLICFFFLTVFTALCPRKSTNFTTAGAFKLLLRVTLSWAIFSIYFCFVCFSPCHDLSPKPGLSSDYCSTLLAHFSSLPRVRSSTCSSVSCRRFMGKPRPFSLTVSLIKQLVPTALLFFAYKQLWKSRKNVLVISFVINSSESAALCACSFARPQYFSSKFSLNVGSFNFYFLSFLINFWTRQTCATSQHFTYNTETSSYCKVCLAEPSAFCAHVFFLYVASSFEGLAPRWCT